MSAREPSPPCALLPLDADGTRHASAARVLHELVDALLAEDVLGFCQRSEVSVSVPACFAASGPEGLDLADGECSLRVPLESGYALLMRVRRQSFFQPFRLSRLPVWLGRGEQGWEELDAVGLMRWLAETLPAVERERALPGLAPFLAALEDATERGRVSLCTEKLVRSRFPSGSRPTLANWERLAALQDRPFHPTARAKRGWSLDDARRYGPEAGETFGVTWVALRRTALEQGPAPDGAAPDVFLLGQEEQARLHAALDEAGVSADEYVPLPVHPWQEAHILPRLYADEFSSRICIPVARRLGCFTATSSLRTLAAAGIEGTHLKLSLGIESLGAVRTLPARYLLNGNQAWHLLERLRERDPALGRRLFLCDERRWWSFRDPAGDLFADKPSHLACQIRTFPSALATASDTHLVPMAALAIMTADGRAPGLDVLLCERAGHAGALALFDEICAVFVEIALRCFQFGVMPELHGQNALLVVRAGRVDAVVLRDHDTLRTHAPWLAAHGLSEPGYVIKPNTPNTLTLGTPEELLAYFQTLAVQVNLYAIAEALHRAHGVPHAAAWGVLRERIASCLERLDGSTPAREVLQRRLLDAPAWPYKCILLPLLRQGEVSTGMPSSLGDTRSPFAASRLPHDGAA